MTPDVSNTGELWIGKGPNNPYFKGDLDEVALYAGLLPGRTDPGARRRGRGLNRHSRRDRGVAPRVESA